MYVALFRSGSLEPLVIASLCRFLCFKYPKGVRGSNATKIKSLCLLEAKYVQIYDTLLKGS